MGSSKLVDRLASLGLNVDADAFAAAMRARPTRSYGGPSSQSVSSVSTRSAGLTNSKARDDAVFPTGAHTSPAESPPFTEPSQSHTAHTPAPELCPDPPSFSTQSQDSWGIISGETTLEEPKDIVYWSSIAGLRKQVPSSTSREPFPTLADIVSVLADKMTLKLGQPSTIGQSFCPILALSKLPYKFMLNQKDLSEHISLEFFADGKFCKSFPACAESFANMSHREKEMDSVC